MYLPIVLSEVNLLSGCDHPNSIEKYVSANSLTAIRGDISAILDLSCSLIFKEARLLDIKPSLPPPDSVTSNDIKESKGWKGSSTFLEVGLSSSSSPENAVILEKELLLELISALTIVCGEVKRFI